MFGKTVPDLLIHHADILNFIDDVPAEFAGMDQPVKHGLAVFIGKAAGIEPGTQFVENQQAVLRFIKSGCSSWAI